MVGFFSLRARLSSKSGSVRPTLQDGGRSKCHNSGNNSRNCTIFGAQEDLGCPFDFSYFDLGVKSGDLSMT